MWDGAYWSSVLEATVRVLYKQDFAENEMLPRLAEITNDRYQASCTELYSIPSSDEQLHLDAKKDNDTGILDVEMEEGD